MHYSLHVCVQIANGYRLDLRAEPIQHIDGQCFSVHDYVLFFCLKSKVLSLSCNYIDACNVPVGVHVPSYCVCGQINLASIHTFFNFVNQITEILYVIVGSDGLRACLSLRVQTNVFTHELSCLLVDKGILY